MAWCRAFRVGIRGGFWEQVTSEMQPFTADKNGEAARRPSSVTREAINR